MKLNRNLIFPDVDEIRDNDWESLREYLETLRNILEELIRDIYDDLKELQS